MSPQINLSTYLANQITADTARTFQDCIDHTHNKAESDDEFKNLFIKGWLSNWNFDIKHNNIKERILKSGVNSEKVDSFFNDLNKKTMDLLGEKIPSMRTEFKEREFHDLIVSIVRKLYEKYTT